MLRKLFILLALPLTFAACDKGGGDDSGGSGAEESGPDPAVEATLLAIGNGAMAYYQSEHAGENPMMLITRVYPDGKACAKGAPEGPIWTALKVPGLKPDDVEFCYAAAPGGKAFAAWAKLPEGGTLCMRGGATPEGPSLETPEEKPSCNY